MTSSQSVGVIGAGITGLTAAFYLKRAGIPSTVYESSDRAGGAIATLLQGGYLAEFGPNTILESSPDIAQLVDDAGLQSRRLYTAPEAKKRYVVRDKRPVALPASPPAFLTSPIFSLRAKLRALREPFVAPRRDAVEESIAQFVERRLGREFVDRALDPFVAGIYAGDPERLSATAAFPKLAQLEQRYGSLLRGQMRSARERRERGEIGRGRARAFSFDDGLQVLPDALRARLGDAMQLRTNVERIAAHDGRWSVDLRDADGITRSAEHDAVVYCGTAHQLAALRVDAPSPGLSEMSGVRYPPVASVVLGFRRDDVRHPCDGFGMLVPKIEGFNILGTIFSSSLFPSRAPAGHIILTTYVGGERTPEVASLPQDALVALTRADLGTLLGATGDPTFVHTAYYPRAIAQYDVGYDRYRRILGDIEASAPNLFFAGHYRDGISLGDSIVSGRRAAERVAGALR